MRLLLNIEYYKVLFGKGADVSELIKSFDGAIIVDEDRGGSFSGPTKYNPSREASMSIQLINDDSVMLPENDDGGEFENYHKVATERDKLKTEVKELTDKLKAIEDATQGKNEEKK